MLLAGGVLALIVGGLWTARLPIADSFIADQFERRGVPASYRIERIGLNVQRLTDIRIGDPDRPDLTARVLEVTIGYGLTGPYVARIRGQGVRLYGRFADGRLSLGALDKFRDPTNTDPFALPDIAVVLDDARARVDTPWGPMGAALNGRGNLRTDFDGRLALVARAIDVAGCRADGATFYGKLGVRDVKPRLQGPLRARSLACGGAGVRLSSPQIAIDAALSEDLQNWNGKASARVAGLTAAGVRAETLGIFSDFSGSAAKTAFGVTMDVARLGAGDMRAERVKLTGKGHFGQAAPAFDGRIAFDSASAGADLRRRVARSAAALTGTPIGPLATRAAGGAARALAALSGGGDLVLAGAGKTARLDIVAAQLSSGSGARFTGDADSRISYLFGMARPAVIASGTWRFGGGDLPAGSIALDRRGDGSVSGLAQFEPYAAADARLVLRPIRFSNAAGGALRFATAAELSGPLAGGRIERLAFPLAGTLSPRGDLSLDGGCSRVSAALVAVGGFRLANNAVALCSRPGAPLLAAGAGGLRGAVRIPGIALRGSSGTSPFAFDARGAAIDFAGMRWSLAGADVRLGDGEDATRFAADRIVGAATATDMAGQIAGAKGQIGAVPLRMSDIAGDWRLSGGILSLDGGLLLTDADPDPRFAPLVSDDATLRFANGVIDASAGFNEPESGVKILDTVIRHQLATTTGSADLIVKELRFDERFQPDQLTRLARGVIANVDGSVVGDGRIEWTADGVKSRGTFATANSNLAAAFGPVTGATATISFDDLLGLHTVPRQTVRLAEVNPGIPVIDGEIEYQLLGDNRVRIQGGSWPFAGGELVLHPTTLNFNATEPRRLTFDIVGVEAAVFLQNFGFDNINATGKFDGTLPVEFDGLGGRIVNGRIDSRDGGGTLAYVGELSNHNLGVIANFAFGALRSLKYDDLAIILNGNLDGEMVTDIRFGGVGQGEGATRNFLTNQVAKLPLVFNVKIKAPFRQLITSAKGFYDPSILIEQNLPLLLQVQEQAATGQPGAATPVQPPESESVQ
ncbi:MAG: hypothetical protein DI569_05185 [Sphingopyxis macrogoltabida]|uniref:Uncharacterized protein n=1 Tax=Sphingopyxis macrogoltabida TaxID=33050 RepID=A0A2W5L755_SPHMC|nr:MAG: hypothetical protein DI569_05185 [Sphingopyxis macrogoltabida]